MGLSFLQVSISTCTQGHGPHLPPGQHFYPYTRPWAAPSARSEFLPLHEAMGLTFRQVSFSTFTQSHGPHLPPGKHFYLYMRPWLHLLPGQHFYLYTRPWASPSARSAFLPLHKAMGLTFCQVCISTSTRGHGFTFCQVTISTSTRGHGPHLLPGQQFYLYTRPWASPSASQHLAYLYMRPWVSPSTRSAFLPLHQAMGLTFRQVSISLPTLTLPMK